MLSRGDGAPACATNFFEQDDLAGVILIPPGGGILDRESTFTQLIVSHWYILSVWGQLIN